jgi:hypothetical protein
VDELFVLKDRLAMCQKGSDMLLYRLSNVSFGFFARLAIAKTSGQGRTVGGIAFIFLLSFLKKISKV